MRHTVDHQKTKFYQAEHEAIRTYNQQYSEVVLNLDDAQWFLQQIKSSWFFKKNNGSPMLKLHEFERRKDIIGFYSHQKNRIYLDPHAMTEINICHEVAHHLQSQISEDLPAHGPVFTTLYLGLVFSMNTNGYFSILLSSFLDYDVDYYHQTLQAQLLPQVAN